MRRRLAQERESRGNRRWRRILKSRRCAATMIRQVSAGNACGGTGLVIQVRVFIRFLISTAAGRHPGGGFFFQAFAADRSAGSVAGDGIRGMLENSQPSSASSASAIRRRSTGVGSFQPPQILFRAIGCIPIFRAKASCVRNFAAIAIFKLSRVPTRKKFPPLGSKQIPPA